MAKKPEQVHIEHRVATTPWVESGGVSVAIGEEHRESTRKHGQGEQEQKVGDEHAPHKQGNSLHRQCQCLALIDLGLKFTLYVVREDRQEEPAGMRGVPKEPSPMECGAASINPRRVQRAHKAQGKSHGAQGLSLD